MRFVNSFICWLNGHDWRYVVSFKICRRCRKVVDLLEPRL